MGKVPKSVISNVMRELGRRGGKKKVAKGFGAADPETAASNRRKALEARKKKKR